MDENFVSRPQVLGEVRGNVVIRELHGADVWVTDGTADGTYDLASRRSLEFAGSNSSGLFFALRNEENLDLVRFVGERTEGVPDLEFVTRLSADNVQFIQNIGSDRLLFRTTGGGEAARIWVSDGTEAGTNSLPIPLEGNRRIQVIYDVDSLHFGLELTSTNEQVLWMTDGTDANTWLVRESSPRDTSIQQPDPSAIVVNDSLFFVDEFADGDQALWEARPAARDLNPIQIASQFGGIHVVNETLRYVTSNDVGEQLWQLTLAPDGNRELSLVRDLDSTTEDVAISQLTSVGNQLFFVADSQLWASDGTAEGTRRIRPSTGQMFSTLTNLTARQDWLYFLSTDEVGNGSVWRTKGTSESTELVENIAFVSALFSINDEVFVSTLAPTGLWKLQDSGERIRLATTSRRAVRLNDTEIIVPGVVNEVFDTRTDESRALDFISGEILTPINFGNRVAFISDGKVWATDGTESGTFLLSESEADGFTLAGDRIVFRVDNDFYISDGTALGTTELPIELPGEFTPNSFHYANETLFVFGRVRSVRESRRLFTFRDGNTQTLVTVPDALHNEIVVNELLYFASGNQLWLTDGTTSGTRQIPGVFPSTPSFDRNTEILFANDQLFLLGDDGLHGHELWSVPVSTEPIPGDANRDGELSFADFLLLSANFGEIVFPTEDGDLDGNGRVDFADFLLLAHEWTP